MDQERLVNDSTTEQLRVVEISQDQGDHRHSQRESFPNVLDLVRAES